MNSKAVIAVMLLAVGLLGGCSLPRGGPIKSEITGSSAPDDIAIEQVTRASVREIQKWPAAGWHGHYHWFARQPGPGNRIIRPGDLITLTIWDNQDNSLLLGPEQRSAPLRPEEVTLEGSVFVPYVDNIQVNGLTPQEARRVIQDRLTPIAPSAQVQIEVKSGRRNSADLVSGVRAPGSYPLMDRNVSLLSLIAQAGGVDESVDNPLIRLVRGGQSYEIPVDSLYKDPAKNVIVRGGDQVIVDEEERFFLAVGSTQKEEQVFFHKEHISAMEALAILGGLVDTRANPQGILILREYPESALRTDRSGPQMRHMVFVFDITNADGIYGAKNFQIQPSDIVIASESAVKPAQAVIALAGSLFAINNLFD
ncbi:polysaccharide biosynthesis/export family protein [Shimia sp. Alg240-R146]|uniref:polysaccharide biosynthesis/export family protein n=1 Tax=Shimia sp. Alg240-R146 TaxID=2993449 RepID=UPI0022E740C1|nr:polysaccharide biosynthesis/export family protein [Shimia sp. Alg240-R146]